MARGQCWWRPGPGRFHVPWATTLRDRNDLPLLSADDLTSEMLTELSVIAVPVVAEKRLTSPAPMSSQRCCERDPSSRFASAHDRMAMPEWTIAVAVADEPSPAVTVSEPGPGLSSIIEVRTRTRGRRQQP